MEAMHRSTKVLPRDPSETIPLIEQALEAVELALRQMPDEKLDWSIPKRKRPMRSFCLHIFSHALSIIEGRRADNSGRPEVSSDSYNSFQDIADHGRIVIEKFRAWASQQQLDTLRNPVTEGLSQKIDVKRLDAVAGQIVHHLRQLYSILEDFGITPENRVPDSEWPSDYVLTMFW
ncbi:hypothetical protein ACFLVH_01030 [Chloroflexota bacterium]